MNRLATEYPICRLSSLLGVSRAGFYRSNGQGPRAQADAELVEQIRDVYKEHKQRYGSPRVQIELKRRGTVCGTNRVARLMREEGLKGISAPRKHPQTTDSNHEGPIAPNLLKRLEIEAPNQVWAMDITYLRCGERWVYLAAVLDLYLHKIVGWELSESINSELAEGALRNATRQQGYPEAVLVHSDRGSQYASSDFIALVDSLGYERSMSAKGNCYDNATMESFFGVLKREELDRWEMNTPASVRNRVFAYIETYYNRKRIHTALGMPPAEFETTCDQRAPSAEFSEASVAPSVGKEKAGAVKPRPRPMVATSEYPSESCSPADLSSVSSDTPSIHQPKVELKDKKEYVTIS